MEKDPVEAIIDEYLKANPGGSWDENRGVLRLIIWLRDRGYLKIKE
jgi:hypothetical protein